MGSSPAVCMAWWALLAAATTGAACLGQSPGIYGIGDLPGGGFFSRALGVSGDGSTVVGYSNGALGQEAVRWSFASGLIGLGDLPGGTFYSEAFASSFDGSVIAGSSNTAVGADSIRRATRWVNGGTPESLGPLPGTNRTTLAQAVTPDGSTIVGWGINANNGEEAFRWTESGGMEALGRLPSPGGNASSRAYGVSGDGQRIIGASNNKAYQWTQATGMVEIPPQPGASSTRRASAISAIGDVVVGQSFREFGGMEAFMWTPDGGTIGLGWLLPLVGTASASHALAVNGDGSIIVGTDNGRAFIWDPLHGMRHLRQALLDDYGISTTGWGLGSAEGISADGTVIVGNGTDPQGRPTGWVIIIPAPSSAAILGLAAFSALRRRR